MFSKLFPNTLFYRVPHYDLVDDEKCSDDDLLVPKPEVLTIKPLWLYVFAPLFWMVGSFLILVAVMTLATESGKKPSAPFVQNVYSPAEEVVLYHEVTFTQGFSRRTKYQGPPSDAVDRAWEDLYQFGISRITGAEAAKLPNATAEIPGDPDHYIVELDVFHQLHCLNKLRRRVWPEYYDAKEPRSMEHKISMVEHLDHCIDSIRQALMCHSDISTYFWQWDENQQETLPVAENVHTCRDFESVRKWALEHQLEVPFDKTVRLSNTPVHNGT